MRLPNIDRSPADSLADLSSRVLDLVGRNIDMADSLLARVRERSKKAEAPKGRWESSRGTVAQPKNMHRRKWMSQEEGLNKENTREPLKSNFSRHCPQPGRRKNNSKLFLRKVKEIRFEPDLCSPVSLVKLAGKSVFKECPSRVYDSFDCIQSIFGSVSRS